MGDPPGELTVLIQTLAGERRQPAPQNPTPSVLRALLNPLRDKVLCTPLMRDDNGMGKTRLQIANCRRGQRRTEQR